MSELSRVKAASEKQAAASVARRGSSHQKSRPIVRNASAIGSAVKVESDESMPGVKMTTSARNGLRFRRRKSSAQAAAASAAPSTTSNPCASGSHSGRPSDAAHAR